MTETPSQPDPAPQETPTGSADAAPIDLASAPIDLSADLSNSPSLWSPVAFRPVAEPRPYLPPPRPRVWPTVVVAFSIIPAAIIVAGIALAVAAAFHGKSDVLLHPARLDDWLATFLLTPAGFLWATLPGQLVFIGAAIVAGRLSPQPMKERLGLRESRLGLAPFVLLPLATPTIAIITGMFLGPLIPHDGGEQLQQMEKMITGPTGWHAFLVIALVSLLPGFAEELVFRGYIQQRLTAAWGAIPAILFAGVFFAAAHLDLVHSLLVFPLGLWLGLVAWRTGTVWVAILCHAYYNLFQCMLARAGWAQQAGAAGADEMPPLAMAVMAVTLLAFAAAVVMLMWDAVRGNNDRSPPLAASRRS